MKISILALFIVATSTVILQDTSKTKRNEQPQYAQQRTVIERLDSLYARLKRIDERYSDTVKVKKP